MAGFAMVISTWTWPVFANPVTRAGAKDRFRQQQAFPAHHKAFWVRHSTRTVPVAGVPLPPFSVSGQCFLPFFAHYSLSSLYSTSTTFNTQEHLLLAANMPAALFPLAPHNLYICSCPTSPAESCSFSLSLSNSLSLFKSQQEFEVADFTTRQLEQIPRHVTSTRPSPYQKLENILSHMYMCPLYGSNPLPARALYTQSKTIAS